MNGEIFDYHYCFNESAVKIDSARISTICCIVAYLFDDIKRASKWIKYCRKFGIVFGNLYGNVVFYFYEGLILSSEARSIYEKEEFIKVIQDDIDILESYAEHAIENFMNKIFLLKAELAVICNEISKAESHYEKAIALANKNNFVNEAAIACERAAMFYFDLNSEIRAKELLLESYKCYRKWGAYSKMSHMIRRYPFLIEALKDPSITNESNIETIRAGQSEEISLITDSLSFFNNSASQGQNKKS